MKEFIKLQREIWNLMVNKSELENDIKRAKYLYENITQYLNLGKAQKIKKVDFKALVMK